MEAIASSFESEVAALVSGCAAGSSILVAVSGGADSTALLLSLVSLRHRLSLYLHCVHIDHGIRPESECSLDAAAVLALCRRLKVPASRYRISRGKIAALAPSEGGLEAAARRLRHGILKKEMRRVGARWIALGHTRDDALEHVLMRFLRGAGPAGLAALPAVKDPLIRPLIGLSRSRVESYLHARAWPYRTDTTNADTRFFRNLVRIKLVPFLDDAFPFWRNSVAALAETQALAARSIAEGAEVALPWESLPSPGGMLLRVPAAAFFGVSPILREEALFTALGRLSRSFSASRPAALPVPRRRSLRRFTSGDAVSLDLGEYRIDRWGEWVQVSIPRSPESLAGFSLLLEEVGKYDLRCGVAVEVHSAGVPEPCQVAGRSGETRFGTDCFSASLPALLRSTYPEDRLFLGGRLRRIPEVLDRAGCSGYTDIIVAEDAFGIAALILPAVDSKVTLIATDEDGGPRHLLFSVLARR